MQIRRIELKLFTSGLANITFKDLASRQVHLITNYYFLHPERLEYVSIMIATPRLK